MYDVEFLLGNLFIELYDSKRDYVNTDEIASYAAEVIAFVNVRSDKKIIYNYVRDAYEDLMYTCPIFRYEYKTDGYPIIHFDRNVKLEELIDKYRSKLTPLEIEALSTSSILDNIREENSDCKLDSDNYVIFDRSDCNQINIVNETIIDSREHVTVAHNIDSVTNATISFRDFSRTRKEIKK